jgi:putative transposase
MNEVYQYTGCSKQGFHQKMSRILREQEQHILLLPLIAELRREHPGVGVRQLYLILRPDHIGRDNFEALCFSHGLKLSPGRAFKRTTDSRGVIRFPNLIEGREFTGINQVWVSDITYYQIGEEVFYLTFIMDLYSRKIVGYSVSMRLLTEQTTLPALQMALRLRRPTTGLIFHSDGGGQYYCKAFQKLTQAHRIKNSMGEIVYENPYAERINGTIKNQYLKGYNPGNFADLVRMTKRAVQNYNRIRPHSSLNQMPPEAYEKQLSACGSSSETNDFCSIRIPSVQHLKNHLSQLRPKALKIVNKTVNVF